MEIFSFCWSRSVTKKKKEGYCESHSAKQKEKDTSKKVCYGADKKG